jgi:HAD superfamily hydrolase (TIGR01458 family)
MHPRGLLIDIDGVLTVSWKPIPGSREALRRLRESGAAMVFVTNTTSMTRSSIAAALVDAELPVTIEEILTAPSMAAAVIRRDHPGGRCWMVGAGNVVADLDGIRLVDGSEPPDVVILGGAGPEFDYPNLNRVFRLAMDGTPVVAMHRNLYWKTQDGLQLDTGAFLAAIEQAAGIQATVAGKPAPACFQAGLEVLGLGPDEVIMVGDDLDADVMGAQAMGIESVLVRTGKFRSEALARSQVVPDHVVDSFADIPRLLDL